MELYQLSFPNGKSYIGITSLTAIKRFQYHCRRTSRNTALNPAIKKYGRENVVITVLAETDNWELLCLAEQEAIDKYKSKAPNGYNLTHGGEGVLGLVTSEETRAKQSASKRNMSEATREKLRNRIFTEETRKKMSDSKQNISDETRKKMSLAKKNISEETRNKMSASQKNRPPISEETRAKLSVLTTIRNKNRSPDIYIKAANSKRGRVFSDEIRARMSEGQKNSMTDERLAKMSAVMTGKKHTEETKKKLSLISKERMTPEFRAKISEVNKGNTYCLGFKHTEETKKKLSEARKGNTYSLGFKHTEETRKKQSLAKKGVPHSEEHRLNLAEANRKRCTGNKHSVITKARIAVARATYCAKRLSRPYSPVTWNLL
jgi:group I intron endonuclease